MQPPTCRLAREHCKGPKAHYLNTQGKEAWSQSSHASEAGTGTLQQYRTADGQARHVCTKLCGGQCDMCSERGMAWKKKKKDFTSFCQPTQPIACANHGNHVQIIMKSRQSTT